VERVMARKIAAAASTSRGWLDSVRPLITAQVDNESLLERRYNQLITAATRLFEQKGFDRTTIEEIATQLDLSVGAIYRYVERKEDILLLTLARTLWGFQLQVGEATADVHEAEEKLRRAIRIYFQNIASYAHSALLAYRESYVLTGEARRLLKDLERETNRIFEAILTDGIAQGAFRRCRVDVATYNIVMLAHTWALKRWYLAKVISLDAYIDEQTEFILLGLRRRSPLRSERRGPVRRRH
jgi:TetR/AcrR family transcriptional regulator, cholesterol catabolism regulator